MSSVFLSHSHADKPFARKLAADLRVAGHSVWIDEAEINVGDSLVERIRDGLDQVEYVAGILSTSSIASPWVTRELDIASNREMREKRVVVLPLLLHKVPLPGFLEGKFYADFTEEDRYSDALKLLLRTLGPGTPIPKKDAAELERLTAELDAAKAAIAQQTATLRAHERAAVRGKSPALIAAIKKANKDHPEHAPINATYAFEVMGTVVTLDYLLWSIGKAMRKGGHVLDVMLSMENKWHLVKAMLDAYSEMLRAEA